MKRLMPLMFLVAFLSACSTKVQVIPVAGNGQISECKDFQIGTVQDKSGYVPGEGEEVFDLEEAMKKALITAFNEGHILKLESPYRIDTTIRSYSPGNAAARWLMPGAGATVLHTESTIYKDGKPLAVIPIERTIAAGGGYTIGAWKYVFDDVAEALVKALGQSGEVANYEGRIPFKNNKIEKDFKKYKHKSRHKAFFINPFTDSWYFVWGYKNKKQVLAKKPYGMITYRVNSEAPWGENYEKYKATSSYKALKSYYDGTDFDEAYRLLKKEYAQNINDPYLANKFAWSGLHLIEEQKCLENKKRNLCEEALANFKGSIANGWVVSGNYEGIAKANILLGNYEGAMASLNEGLQRCSKDTGRLEYLQTFVLLAQDKLSEARRHIQAGMPFWGLELATEKEGVGVILKPVNNSPVFEAGILQGDIIKRIGRQSMKGYSATEAVKYLKGLTVGDESVDFLILRGDAELTLRVKPIIGTGR